MFTYYFLPCGPLAVIPYTVKVTTGEGEDNGTSSNVWVKIYGPQKKHTGRLFLELAQKDQFAPGSVEIFSLEAAELDEIKKIEVGVLMKVFTKRRILVQELCESRGGRPGRSVLTSLLVFRGRKDLLNRASALVSACP